MRVLKVAEDVYAVATRIADLAPMLACSADRELMYTGTPLNLERRAVRVLLRWLLMEVLDPEAALARLAVDARGAPFLMGRPELAVSLSHSGGWVAAAARKGGGGVGVDVQVPATADDRLIRRCCRPAVHAKLRWFPAPRRAEELAWIWTVQEACVKANGAGIAAGPWTIPVGLGEREGYWRDVAWRAFRGECRVPFSCAFVKSTAMLS